MTRCPHCFHALSPDHYAWNCVGPCERRLDERTSALHGAAVYLGPMVRVDRPTPAPRGWAPPDPVHCPSCATVMREACPDCRYQLPPHWREAETLCIAMAGARATGKSIYLGVLVKQIAQLTDKLGSTLHPATDQTAAIYRDVYERALFEERGLLTPTAPVRGEGSYQREPLIYSLGMLGGRRAYVVLRDVAGEDLETPNEEPPYLAFFRHADGVIFMFDPLRVPEVRDHLHDLVPAQLATGGDPLTVLTRVLRLIGDGSASVAVVLSKFDAMQALRAVAGTEWSRIMSRAGAGFLRDAPISDAPYDEEDGRLVHLEVRSLLQRLGANSIVASLERPHDGRAIQHRFFAVSALGESAEGDKLHVRGISPFRCLDPVRWLLASSTIPV